MIFAYPAYVVLILVTIKMIGQFSMTNSAELGGIFKSKSHFCLKVAQYCESQGKSAVQTRGNKRVIHLVCKHQLYEKKRVLKLNKTGRVQKVVPEIKCVASFKAV